MQHKLLIALIGLAFCVPHAHADVTITIDPTANVHPISPLIYGVAFGKKEQLADLKSLNRHGGNATSQYNWQLNASNRGNDWFFESIAEKSPEPGASVDDFIAESKAGDSEPMVTIPTIPWVAKIAPDRGKLASFSIKKYGAQKASEGDAGNGVGADGKNITGNDPNDANTPNSPDFEAAWIKHIVGKWGTADKGGLKYYIMDNEPSIWFSTHRDVAPQGATMEQIRDAILAYSAVVKAADPAALVVGPEEWGWGGFLNSGADQQYGASHGWSGHPDRDAHGGMDYLPWLLQEIKKHDDATGHRSLDVFSVHYYPQGGEFGENTSEKMELRRNESTRELWDPNYKSKTWIASEVQLIPRIRKWVDTYYPGTKIAITEYNWGAEKSMNGATAEADILGIFGREGLDIATRWTAPDPKTPTWLAMKMYRNYDGKGGMFGDTSVSDIVPNPDEVSSFAAIRSSDGALTVMVINKKLSGDTQLNLQTGHYGSGSKARVWQLTSTNQIRQITDLADTGSATTMFTTSLPAQSITLFVIPKR